MERTAAISSRGCALHQPFTCSLLWALRQWAALKGQLKPWNFTHADQRTGRVVAQPGLVMARHRKDALRLPLAVYDASVV